MRQLVAVPVDVGNVELVAHVGGVGLGEDRAGGLGMCVSPDLPPLVDAVLRLLER